MFSMKKKIIVIVGPTASGKTALGVHIAEKFNGEVVSADSMQIYKGMDIATAKPTNSEMRGIAHHLIGFVDQAEKYSVSSFCKDASVAVNDIVSRNKLPVMVGGTGLYIDSFITATEFLEDASSERIREQLKNELTERGIDDMYAELTAIDPECVSVIHKNNTVRVLRALEVYRTTGKTITEQKRLSHLNESEYEPLFIGIGFKNREVLYERINNRVDLMLENGLLDEARRFFTEFHSCTAVSAIGYKELKPYIDGVASLSACVETLKRETRKYAKRQLTWFRRNSDINWLYLDEYKDVDTFFKSADSLIAEFTEVTI